MPLTEDAHVHRMRLMFQRALGTGHSGGHHLGAPARLRCDPLGRPSKNLREVSDETVAYLYLKLLL
jgi:hypothetical protein